ncbi:ladderlectin-like isoform X2 [Xyrichtys novacula]|uniref:Ladderlectin-like isoform X2 n=1 Tax=Xyrichtys novacula TaxID=13765 RepID=A0AAV1HE16_XYRNO|nr:ladderlectin-like isoform X2 [Xyrichtys novacula]
MASGLYFFVFCWTIGLWITENVGCSDVNDDCDESCPPGWVFFESRCFQFQDARKAWADAESHCTLLGGNLPSIRTAAEYAFLRQLVFKATRSHRETWLGGYDAPKEGVWLWSDGTQFLFTGWGRGEPNNHRGEGCMEMNLGGRDYVNDKRCNMRRSYICARKP